MSESGVYLALLSTIVFALSSIVFQVFAQKLGALWMNAFKATVALMAFGIFTGLTKSWESLPSLSSFLLLFGSGFIGLNIGDLLLLSAFKRIGSARTLMIFSFQPLMMALFAYLTLGQALSPAKFVAIFFMIACVFTISYEKYRSDKRWELWGPLFAFGGVLLDCAGVLMTRFAFDGDPQITVFEANFYRCIGAGLGFLIIAQFFPFKFKKRFLKLRWTTKALVLGASFTGTFLALWAYLTAIETGHLGKIAAVVGSGPLFTALFEALVFRKWPSRYLWIGLVFFMAGFALLSADFL